MSSNDYPHDVELGLEPDPVARVVVLRCGCDVFEDDMTHDEADCLEAQADVLAEMEQERRR